MYKTKLRSIFIDSKHRTLNFFIFSCLLAVLSRVLMYFLFIVVKGDGSDFIPYVSQVWDNAWYGSIINGGYVLEPNQHLASDAANWAFFPLSPLLVKLFSFGGSLDYRYVGFFINTFFTALAVTVSYKYIMFDGEDKLKTAIFFALLVFFGPYGFYCACLYTEALFMLLSMLFMYELRRENYIVMGIVGAFLSAVRVTGVMTVLAVLLYLIQKHVNEKRGGFKQFVCDVLSKPKLVFGVCLVPLGLFSYMLYLRLHMGDALAFMHIQKAWGRTGVNIFALLRSVFTSETYTDFHYLVVFMLIIAIAVYQGKKRPYEIIPYTVPCIINFTSMGFMNLARYSWGSGMIIIGFINALDEHLSKSARIFVYILLAITAVRLQYWWFKAGIITIG